MTKVVVNAKHGGFSVSEAAARAMAGWGSLHAQAEVAEYDRKARGEFKDDVEREWNEKFPNRWHGYLALYDADGKWVSDISRDDPALVRAVEEMGPDASGTHAYLAIVEIPDDVASWHIEDYDGLEHVAEDHRTWQ